MSFGRQLHQLQRLVNDLLDVEGIAAGRVAIKSEILDLADVAIRAVETTRPALEAGEHRMALDLPRAPLLIRGDADRLTQVLINLLDNAAHYTPHGGQIFLTLVSKPPHALIRVRDTGVGIAPELLPHVFKLFVRDPSHRVAGSWGIGLALAKELIEAHNGTIRAESEGHGKGSQFLVQLPQLLTQDLVEV